MGFAAVILMGSVLLVLPWSHAPGEVSYLDALFTSTSAVCVTGLVVVDTGTAFTGLGQFIIMVLIQIGGLGVMTGTAMIFALLGRRLSLRSQAALHDSLFQGDAAHDFRLLFVRILKVTFAVEGLGVAVLFVAFLMTKGNVFHSGWSALFHSVSAFCNAGFSIYSDNLLGARVNPLITFTIMGLIVAGGLGLWVLAELWIHAKHALPGAHPPAGLRRLSLHAKVVLTGTAILISVGFVGLLVFGLTPGEPTIWDHIHGALFQSITSRTAGFNTVDIGKLPSASILLLTILMFIGANPASCAGGVKITTVAIFLAQLRSIIRNQDDVTLFERRIPGDVVRRVNLLLAVAVMWNTAGLLFLLVSQAGSSGMSMERLLFEQISAFGTVGLSTGITPDVSGPGQLELILTMYVGRVGPLTLATWALARQALRIGYPEGKVMIG